MTTARVDGEAGPRAVLGWALFLACSWTWCIGMFLPVLMLRDFGWAGFAVFAVPNVIGAAAMGVVIASRVRGAELLERHRPMVMVFSLVTVLYHVLFFVEVVGGLGGLLRNPAFPVLMLPVAALIAAAGPSRPLAAVVFAISLAAGVVWMLSPDAVPGVRTREVAEALSETRRPLAALAALAPASTLGFLLCPYLDGTFWRARLALSDRSARWAFGLGFGVFFLLMILLTASYSSLFWPAYAPRQPIPDRLPLALIVAHLTLQGGLTVGYHLRVFAERKGTLATVCTAVAGIAIVLAVALMALPRVGMQTPPRLLLPATVEPDPMTWYWVMLGFYGLVFPAYVWICMLPRRGWRGGPAQPRYALWLGTVLLASPMFAAGFLGQREIWLLPAVAIVLLARFIPPRRVS